MVLGKMPTNVLATRYGLHELYDLSQAIRLGDLRSFDQIMTRHQQSFLRLGIYLVLEQCKTIAYRCLLKRLYLLNGSNTRVSLQQMLTCVLCLSALSIDREIPW